MNSLMHVAVEPRRAERVLGHHPARREDHEVAIGGARRVGRRGQHREDRRVGMVEADRADRVEAREVVFVRRVVAVPGDDVERRMVELGRPQMALELRDELAAAPSRVLERGARASGSRAGWRGRWRRSARARAGGTARRSSRRHSRAARPSGSSTRKLTPRGIDRDLAGRRVEHAELGAQQQAALLRHDQQLAVGVVEDAVGHRAVGAIDVDADAAACAGVAVAADRHQAVDEVGRARRETAAGPSAAGSATARPRCRARVRISPSSMRRNGRCIADGRMR